MKDSKITIQLNDGTSTELDLRLNIAKLMYINNDFKTDEFVEITFSEKGDMKYTLIQGVQAMYIAYRQAHMHDYMSFEEFNDKCEFDNELAMQVFYSMIYKSQRSEFQKAFSKNFKSKK